MDVHKEGDCEHACLKQEPAPLVAAEGLKHPSWIMCDNLVSIRKSELTDYVGSLSGAKRAELNDTLKLALDLD